MATIRANTVMLFAVSSPRMNHFGTNPSVGGRPPSENSRIGVEIRIALFLAQEIASVLIVLAPVISRMLNMQ